MHGHAPRRTRRARYRYGGGSICGARQPARYPRGLPSPLPAPRAPHRARGGNDPANLRNAEVRALRAKGHAANIGNPHVGSIHAREG